jgi:hypothetical protein
MTSVVLAMLTMIGEVRGSGDGPDYSWAVAAEWDRVAVG